VADAEFRYADLLPTGADDTPYRLDLAAQSAQDPAVRLRVRLPSRSGLAGHQAAVGELEGHHLVHGVQVGPGRCLQEAAG